jgi:hypothetical protein
MTEFDYLAEIELLRHHYTELQKRFVDCYTVVDGNGAFDAFKLYSLLMEVQDELKSENKKRKTEGA